MVFKIFSPAKINLFLSITGRRDNGYHELETLFQLLDVGDDLTFLYNSLNQSNRAPAISLNFTNNTLNNIYSKAITTHPIEDNLIIKAAHRLIDFALKEKIDAKFCDVIIELEKNMPLGAGLGAGSSNAASTLIALNLIWQPNLSKETLSRIALSLGADVPIFIHNHSAFATGLGEIITPVMLQERWYILIYPNISIPTQQLFNADNLKRDCLSKSYQEWLNTPFYNVFTPVATSLFSEVAQAIDWLNVHSKAYMSGTGSTIFAAFHSKQDAEEVLEQVPKSWWSIIAKGVNTNKLFD